MSTEQCTGHVFSPHTFVHTTERCTSSRETVGHHSPEDTAAAAAALCSLPTTVTEGMKRLDARTFQHIWAQIKECSDRLRDLTTIATLTVAETKPIASSAPALFPLLQQLLALFHTFNSSVQKSEHHSSPSSSRPTTPAGVSAIVTPKRKFEKLEEDESVGACSLTAMTMIKHEPCEEKLEKEDVDCDHPNKRQKRARRNRSKPTLSDLRCHHCGETDTPEWRRGPAGPKTLCNACGLQYAKYLREADKREKCRLPLSLVLNS